MKVAVAILLIASALILYQLQGPPRAMAEKTMGLPSIPSVPSRDSMTVPLVDPSLFDVVVERPLFMPDRKPQPVDVGQNSEQPASPPSPPVNVQLLGIVESANGRLALLKSREQAAAYIVGTGKKVDGWQVKNITARMVTLTLDGNSHILKLFSPPEKDAKKQSSGSTDESDAPMLKKYPFKNDGLKIVR